MNNFLKTIIKNSGAILLLIFGFISCEEEAPTKVYNNDLSSPAPKITSVDPADFAYSYASKIKITGENFSAANDPAFGNKVYFDNQPGTIISSSATEIVVIPPDIVGDSVRLKVINPKAEQIAVYYPYKISSTTTKFDQFLSTDSISAIDLDSQENLYALLRTENTAKILKVTTGGIRTDYGTAPFPTAYEMKIGPGGYLYILRTGPSGAIHRVAPGGGTADVFVTLSAPMRSLDFDQNQNLFVAGSRTNLFVVNQSGTFRVAGNYGSFDIRSIRVFNGFLYFTALYSGSNSSFPPAGIWRSQITSADGDLGDPEVVYNWADAGSYSNSFFGPLTFSTDGDMFIGTDYSISSNPVINSSILIVHPNGSSEPLYPGHIVPLTRQLVWGNGNFLYQNRGNFGLVKGIFKIYVDKLGAPYYGRQ
jgi:hypothetical protein